MKKDLLEDLFFENYRFLLNFLNKKNIGFSTKEDIEEVINSTFEFAFDNYGKEKNIAKFSTYLCEVAYNKLRNQNTKNKRYINFKKNLIIKYSYPSYIAKSPYEILEQKEQMNYIFKAISSLQLLERKIIKMKFYGDYSLPSIGKTLGCSYYYIYKNYKKALLSLKIIMNTFNYDLFGK